MFGGTQGCVSEGQRWVVSNYTEGVISVSKKKGTAVLGMWGIREGGIGSGCIICEFFLGQDDQ